MESDWKVIGVEITCRNLTDIQFEAEVWGAVIDGGLSERPLVVVDEEGIITYCNDTGAEALQDTRAHGSKVVGQVFKSLVGMRSRSVVDDVIDRIYTQARELSMPLIACEMIQRHGLGSSAPLMLKWLASGYFDAVGDIKGAMFELQAFPVVAFAIENTEESQYRVLQQSQAAVGVFSDDLTDVPVGEILGAENLETLKQKLIAAKGAAVEAQMVFAGGDADKLLKWKLNAALRPLERETQEVRLVLQCLDVV